MSEILTLRNFLWNDNIPAREKFLEMVQKNDIFMPRYNISLDEEREIAYQRLLKLAESKLISVKDFWHNPLNIFASFVLNLDFNLNFLFNEIEFCSA